MAFLPVTIQSGGVVLKAILRVEARVGIAFETLLQSLPIASHVGAGVEARVYANIAEFVTNITLGEVDLLNKRDDDDDNCRLSIAQEFTFGVGAAAGASLVIFGNTFGPTPETEIPIFYHTLAQACVVSTTNTAAATTTVVTTTSASATGKRTGGPSVTSTVTTETQVATVCASAGLINCPASLQSLTKNVITRTLTSTVASGVSAVWSTSTASTFSTVDFQADAVTMTSSSGKPRSYTPPPPTTTTSLGPTDSATGAASAEGKSGKHRVSNAVIIGVSVGLGVPVLLAAVGAIM